MKKIISLTAVLVLSLSCSNASIAGKKESVQLNNTSWVLGATRMLCDNISVEEDYLNLLEKVNKYVISETSLELYKDNVLLLKFKRK